MVMSRQTPANVWLWVLITVGIPAGLIVAVLAIYLVIVA